MNTVFISAKSSPGCLVQILWFAFVGWWLGEIWIVAAWIAMLTLVGIPLGIAMLNRIPYIMALRSAPQEITIMTREEVTIIREDEGRPQHPLIIRALWFVAVGWWFSALWMQLAYFACMSVVGLPIGFWMFDRAPWLLSLHR